MNGRGSIHVGVAMARLGYFDIVPLHVHVRRDLGMRWGVTLSSLTFTVVVFCRLCVRSRLTCHNHQFRTCPMGMVPRKFPPVPQPNNKISWLSWSSSSNKPHPLISNSSCKVSVVGLVVGLGSRRWSMMGKQWEVLISDNSHRNSSRQCTIHTWQKYCVSIPCTSVHTVYW